MRENRNVLCAKGRRKKNGATCVRLSPCLSVNIVSDGRGEKVSFFFTAADVLQQGLFFLKHQPYKLELFLNNPNIKQERGFLREHTRSFVYFVPSFSLKK